MRILNKVIWILVIFHVRLAPNIRIIAICLQTILVLLFGESVVVIILQWISILHIIKF